MLDIQSLRKDDGSQEDKRTANALVVKKTCIKPSPASSC